MSRICTILLCISFCLQAAAQQAKQYFFTHYTARNGLLSNHVEDMVQDQKGFLWIATINGLQRFDGHWFLNFRHDPGNAASIPSDEIWELHLDKQANLWLLFGNGKVGIFNTTTFTFREVSVKVSSERVRGAEKKLVEDSHGNLMLLFPFLELLTYNSKTNTFSSAYNLVQQPPGWTILSMHPDQVTGKIWLGCDSGLAVFNPVTRNINYRSHNPDGEAAIGTYGKIREASTLFIDSKRRLWFLTWPVNVGAPFFYCYNLEKREPVLTAFDIAAIWGGYCEPRELVEQADGRIILTGTPMLAEFSEQQQKFIRIQNTTGENPGSEYEDILAAFSDREMNIWLCTGNDGLYKFNPAAQLFTSISHLHPVTKQVGKGGIMSFLQMKDGSFLASSWGDGTVRYDSFLNAIPLNIRGVNEETLNSVWSYCRRRDGTVWMGLQKEGGNIMLYDEQHQVAKQYRVFERQTVRQVAEDSMGNMWIGTQSKGVHKWTASKAVNNFESGFSKFTPIDNTLVEKLYIDSSGYLWVSTIVSGLYKIDPATDEVLLHLTEKTKPAILHNSVGPVLQYNDSLLLIAGGGLTIYNTKAHTTRFITTADGLPSRYVMSMLKDDQGFVWLGLLNGLCRLNVFTNRIIYFDREDGIISDNFTIDAAMRLKDGRFLFGTKRDFVVFDPLQVNDRSVPPDVVITGFRLSNTPLKIDSLLQLDVVRLSHDNNAVIIDFAALTYLQNSKITYYYQLQGVDKDWIQADGSPRAVYPFLAPGNYIFRVRAANSDGVFSKNTSTVKLEVMPPFWKTWWFLGLMVLATAGILFLIDRERMKRKEALQNMRSSIAGNLHQDINTALGNINVLSEMAKLKADHDLPKSKEFIEQIHSKSSEMIHNMEDMLWAIAPENDSMQKTVERMQEYIEGLNIEYDADVQMLVDEKVAALKLDMQFRHEVFLLFKESIAGLLKVCAANCRIHVGLDKNYLLYTIQFTNDCCDMQQFNQMMQMQQMQVRLDKLRAVMKLHVYPSDATLLLKVPL
jgi:ligand-binding sensor domain-containing protein